MLGAPPQTTLGGLRHLAQEATMSTADHPHDTPQPRDRRDLGDLPEDFSFAMMLSAGAAIVATILALIL
jgi:hypothetical protein